MKREMKKGRLLINNLEQTRMKFFNAANTEAISARNIPTSSPFEVVDQSKYRIINGLSSTGYMTNDDAGFKT
jgi:transcription initiation factor TFIID subunit TAF12